MGYILLTTTRSRGILYTEDEESKDIEKEHKMKNILAILVTFAIMWAIGTMSVYAITEGYQPSTIDIEETTNVTEHTEYVSIIKTVDNVVYVETANGNIYSFYGNGFDDVTETWITIHDGQVVDAWLD